MRTLVPGDVRVDVELLAIYSGATLREPELPHHVCKSASGLAALPVGLNIKLLPDFFDFHGAGFAVKPWCKKFEPRIANDTRYLFLGGDAVHVRWKLKRLTMSLVVRCLGPKLVTVTL